MDRNDRKLYVQILAQMLIADGVLADEERKHLDQIMDSLNMDSEERQLALKGVSMDSPVEERVAALHDDAKKDLLAEVNKALTIDGGMSASEKYFFERVQALLS